MKKVVKDVGKECLMRLCTEEAVAAQQVYAAALVSQRNGQVSDV